MNFSTGRRKNIISTFRADTLCIWSPTIIRPRNSVHPSRPRRVHPSPSPVFNTIRRHRRRIGTTLNRDGSRTTVNHPIRVPWRRWWIVQNGRGIGRSMMRCINNGWWYFVVRNPMRVLRGATGWVSVKPMPRSRPLLRIDLRCSIEMVRWWRWIYNWPR